MITLLIILIIAFCFNSYIFFRNMRVWEFRQKELDKCIPENSDFSERFKEYKSLPEYDTMLLKFWVWPLSRFRKDIT